MDHLEAGQDASRFPFTAFPTGWFQVGYASELPPGGLQKVRYFGRDMILFRGESGQAHLLDAYCPHLGAHIGCGGQVVEDTVRCPFHHWRFDGSGQCTQVPYAGKVPRKAEIRSWPLREVNGILFTFHGPEEWRRRGRCRSSPS